MADYLSPAGPIFGPDFVVVTTNDENGTAYQLQVYPDASNDELRAAGRPMQFYWQPSRVYLAKKQNSPQDYDFGMTVFKGLMTSESTIGITDDVTTNGELSLGGGFLTFATTFAVPPSVIENAKQALKAASHTAPAPWLAHLFGQPAEAPDPLLGIVPILSNNVTIEVPNLVAATAGSKMPMFIEGQGSGKGSIEAQGISAFLVTVNQLAAGAIAGSLEDGKSPFTVHCTLKEQVYIHGCQVKIHLDVDKCYEQCSFALEAGGFFGINEASLAASYQNMVTSGAITTEMQMDTANLTPELKDWIQHNVDDMKKTAFDALKSEIFDWKPREDEPAGTSRGLFSSIFGGASVSLKASYQRHAVKLDQTLKLDTTIAIEHTVSGDLNDLLPAVLADPDKYIAKVDVGEHFRKVQVAATSSINFGELVNGVNLSDPISSVSLEVSYPEIGHETTADGKPNLTTLAQGFHYTPGHKDPTGGVQLAAWTKDNPNDIVHVSFLRLEKEVPDWPADQVKLTKTIVFDALDPRVDLSNGGTTFVVETIGSTHAPKLTADEAGYVFVRFMVAKPLPVNVSLTLTCTIGDRTDTFLITHENQKDIIWEVFSDKFFEEESFTYTVETSVEGPDFTDDTITYSLDAPVTVPVPAGRIKSINGLKVAMPKAPADTSAQVKQFVDAFPPAPI